MLAAIVSLVLIGLNHSQDPAALEEVLETLHAPLQTLYAEYEGKFSFPRAADAKKLGLQSDGLYQSFSGRYWHRMKDSALLADVFLTNYPSAQNPNHDNHRMILSNLGGKIQEFSFSDDNDRGAGRISNGNASRVRDLLSYGKLFVAGHIADVLKFGKGKARREGPEQASGHDCEHIVVPWPGDLPPDQTLTEHFWVDMQRGGQVLKWEIRRGSKATSRLDEVVLEQFPAGQGVMVWLPVSGVSTSGFDEATPQNLIKIFLLRDSVRINAPISDAQFSASYRSDAPITDVVKRARGEFGQDSKPKSNDPGEAEKRLREALAETERQQNELQASSWARGGGRGWMFWLPWAVSLIAFAVIGAVFVRQRRKVSN